MSRNQSTLNRKPAVKPLRDLAAAVENGCDLPGTTETALSTELSTTSLCETSCESASENPPPCPEAVRVRAYELWEAAGCPRGDGVNFWLEAEREFMSPP